MRDVNTSCPYDEPYCSFCEFKDDCPESKGVNK